MRITATAAVARHCWCGVTLPPGGTTEAVLLTHHHSFASHNMDKLRDDQGSAASNRSTRRRSVPETLHSACQTLCREHAPSLESRRSLRGDSRGAAGSPSSSDCDPSADVLSVDPSPASASRRLENSRPRRCVGEWHCRPIELCSAMGRPSPRDIRHPEAQPALACSFARTSARC